MIAVAQSTRAVNDYLNFSQTGVSVLETRLRLKLVDDDLVEAELHRDQLFHANRSGIHAYHIEHNSTSTSGELDMSKFELQSFIGGKKVGSPPIKTQTRKKLDLIEVFNQELPTNVLATFLPNQLVYKLYKMGWFREVVVHRTGCIGYKNEYGPNDPPLFQLVSNRYPVTNVVMEVDFPVATAPDTDQIWCHVIRDSIVSTIDIRPFRENGRVRYVAEVGSLYEERVRVSWNNEKLKRHLGIVGGS